MILNSAFCNCSHPVRTVRLQFFVIAIPQNRQIIKTGSGGDLSKQNVPQKPSLGGGLPGINQGNGLAAMLPVDFEVAIERNAFRGCAQPPIHAWSCSSFFK